MKLKLTPTNVPKLPPSGSDYFDTVAPGLVLRVTPGSRAYAVVYSWHGKTQRAPIGPTHRWELADARVETRRLLRMKDVGVNPAEERRQERAPALTIKDLVKSCLAATELPTGTALRPGTAQEYQRLADVEILPQLGDLPAPGLTRARIRTWSRAIADRGAPYVANRAYGFLRHVFAWSVAEDLIESSPFTGLKAPAPEHASDRVLSADELRALLLAFDELPGQYSDAALLLLLTLTRREMVVGAREPELDLEAHEPRWTVPAERVKGARPHVVPLSAAAIAVIERRLEDADDVLFPPARAARSPVMAWSSKYVKRLCAAMEELLWCVVNNGGKRPELEEGEEHPKKAIERWTIHNLRHTGATHMTEDLGIDDRVVSLLLGHTPPGVSQASKIYNRAERLAERRVALIAWADWLDAVKRGERSKIVPLRRA